MFKFTNGFRFSGIYSPYTSALFNPFIKYIDFHTRVCSLYL